MPARSIQRAARPLQGPFAQNNKPSDTDRLATRVAAAGVPSRQVVRIVTVLAILSLSVTAWAQTVPHVERVTLRHPVEVRIEVEGPDTHVVARLGRQVSEVTLTGAVTEASVERVVTSTGPIAIVRASGEGRTYAALVVETSHGPSLAWSSRVDLHGDPGERVSGAIETTDRTGDGLPDVVVGEHREGVSVCGSTMALLFPRALDDSGALRSVALRRVSGDVVELEATTVSPGPTLPPIGSALRMLAASSAIGVEDASGLSAPRSLTDGDPATGWTEGRGGAGSGELVSGRFDAPHPIRAFGLRASTAVGVEPPRAIWIIGDAGPALHVTLPAAPFDRAFVVPSAPLSWACVSFVIDAASSDAAGLHVGLGEIEAYTDIDFEGGIGALVDVLVAEQDDADRTAEWLARAGTPAIEALTAAWDRLSSLGRRRAVRIAARHAQAPAAAALFTTAAASEDPEVRADAVVALARSGATGAATLVAIAAGDGAGAETAAEALVMSVEGFDVAPLLAAANGAGADRPGLRAAIGARLAHEPRVDAEAALTAWVETATLDGRASVALGLSEPRPDLARAVIERSIAEDGAFVPRYRLALAAAHAEPSDAVDAWLGDVAAHAEEWMLRDAALSAVGTRQPVTITTALRDAYPRVRATAVRMLAHDEGATPALLDRATHDGWPMVRVSALEGLDGRAEGLPALRAAISDDSPMVRARVIELLTAHADAETWPLVRARLMDDDEWPRVIAAGLGLVSALCVPDAADAIDRVMVRGTRPSAWAPDTDVAVLALRVALRLGGETAERARTIATRSTEVESFQPTLDGRDALPACSAP
jgi:hypothetical protein